MASSTRMRSGERTAASCTESVTTCMAGEVSIRQINLSNKQKKKPGSRARPFLLPGRRSRRRRLHRCVELRNHVVQRLVVLDPPEDGDDVVLPVDVDDVRAVADEPD